MKPYGQLSSSALQDKCSCVVIESSFDLQAGNGKDVLYLCPITLLCVGEVCSMQSVTLVVCEIWKVLEPTYKIFMAIGNAV